MHAIGTSGTSGQTNIAISPRIVSSIITIIPKIIIRNRVTAPTNREISRSKNPACAEICLNGANNVRASDPIEKKSAVPFSLSRQPETKIPHPCEYHQDNRPSANILMIISVLSTKDQICYNNIYAAVAQWIRALVFGTRCRGFESLRRYHFFVYKICHEFQDHARHSSTQEN